MDRHNHRSPAKDQQGNSPGKEVDKDAGEKEEEITVVECDLGLDISTSVIGVCVLERKTGNLCHMGNIKLNLAKLQTIWDKIDHAEVALKKFYLDFINKNPVYVPEKASFLPSVKISRIFVEANAKAFTQGFSSADTLFTLAKMNALVSHVTRKLVGVDPLDINLSSARAKLGFKNNRADKRSTKEKVREFVVATQPTLPIKTHVAKTGKNKGQVIPDKETEDELDAWVICRGGQILHP